MPQIRLECSRAVADRLDSAALFAALHKVMVDEAGASLSACKSRIQVVEQVFLVDGAAPRELVNLQVGLIAGRTEAVKAEAGEQALALLRKYLAPLIEEVEVHFSVLLVDMAPTDYFKATVGPTKA